MIIVFINGLFLSLFFIFLFFCLCALLYSLSYFFNGIFFNHKQACKMLIINLVKERNDFVVWHMSPQSIEEF